MSFAETYEPPEPNEWPRGWARVVLATLIGIGFLGWAFASNASDLLKIGMCAVTVVIEGWGFIAAIQWSRALKRVNVALPLAYWAAVVIGCAAWTIFSIYHALGLITGDGAPVAMGALATPAYIAFTALALSLPFHEWAIERVETAAKKPVRAPAAVPQEAPQANPRDAAKRVASELTRQRPRSVSKRHSDAAEERVATRAPPLSESDLRQAVSEMTQGGKVVSIRGVAKHLGVPPSRVERSPARYLLKAVA